jgi:hypothetical protein
VKTIKLTKNISAGSWHSITYDAMHYRFCISIELNLTAITTHRPAEQAYMYHQQFSSASINQKKLIWFHGRPVQQFQRKVNLALWESTLICYVQSMWFVSWLYLTYDWSTVRPSVTLWHTQNCGISGEALLTSGEGEVCVQERCIGKRWHTVGLVRMFAMFRRVIEWQSSWHVTFS